MVAFDSGATLADRFRTHARDADHLYGHVIRAMADDWEAAGPVRTVLRGYEDAPSGSVLQLRLLAGVFRLVLTGRAPELEPFYACLGGTAPPDQAWAVMRTVVAGHVDELRESLLVPPQTNEVGRSAALLVGLADVVRASGVGRVRLLEPGASAGLNLQLDRFRFAAADGSWEWGEPTSPVRLDGAIEGAFDPPEVTVVARSGCDLHPVDATSAEGRLLLTSFVWPFMVERHHRLAAALEVASAHPVVVERCGAADWLEARLGGTEEPDEPDVLPVVWHSITELYWPAAEVERVATVLDRVGRTRPLAQVGMEYAPGGSVDAKPDVRTTLWDGLGGAPRRRLVATAHDHGVPTRIVAG